MLRLGQGTADATYNAQNGWDVAIGITQDVGRAAGIASLVGGGATRVLGDVGASTVAGEEGAIGGCFVAGTLVATADGFREIQDVEVGDQVWSYSNATDGWELRPVEATSVHPVSGDIVTLEIGGDSFVASGNHPVWVIDGEGLRNRPESKDVPKSERDACADGRWVEARSLQLDDVLLSQLGCHVSVTQVTSRRGTVQVYNIRVQHNHTYAVTKRAVLVHNKAAQIAPVPTANPIPRITPGSLPAAEEASLGQTLSYIDAGTTPAGSIATKWGTPFKNWAGDLPGPQGAASPYLEYRVAPATGTSGAGLQRVVVNQQTGEMYYSWTHYGDAGAPAFVKIR
jgi:hypothetical protein